MKRFSVQAVRRALVGKGNLRTRISDRIEGLDPYKRDVVKNLKEIFDEEALRGWVQIQQLFDGIPKITTLENASSLVAHILLLLASDGDDTVKRNAGRNHNSNEIIFKKLVEDKEDLVRWFLAMNNNLPASILETLSKDKSVRVRQCVAAHSNSNSEILERLSTDKDESVRNGVATNPNTPVNIINGYAGL